MLNDLHAAMLKVLEGLNAAPDVIAAYTRRWNETVEGISRSFPCPACFAAGVTDAELRPLPAKGNLPSVVCKTCGRQYSYEEAH